jgi:hypothetical protein
MNSPHSGVAAVWPGGPSCNGPHAVGSFALCPQLHAFAHEMHLRPVVEKLAPAVGTLFHAGLAYRYAAPLNPRPDWFVYKDGYEAINALAKRPEFRDLALDMFAAYEEYYRVDPWTPVLVEHQFVVQLGPLAYSARTDLLALEAGEYVLIDHKSIAKLSDGIPAKYAADRQMLTGLAIARANGYDVRRVVINAATRERPYPSFRRYTVPINHEAFERLGADTQYYIDRMAETKAAFPDPMNRPRNWDACVNVFGPCEFYGLCTGKANWHDFHVPEEHLHGRKAIGK